MKRKSKRHLKVHEIHFKIRNMISFDWQSRPKCRVFEDKKKKYNKTLCRKRIDSEE